MSGNLIGYITEKQEFLFPDTELGNMPQELNLVSAQNGMMGVQVLFQCMGKEGTVSIESENFRTEYYQMIDIPVEYNTGNGVDQGGAMVLLTDECPDYAVRKAPFRVYDCLRPLQDGTVASVGNRAAVYVCLAPLKGISSGQYELELHVSADGKEHVCQVCFEVMPVMIEEERFAQTNWFSLAAIESFHQVKQGTPEFLEVLRKYARAMKRTHQKVFQIGMSFGKNSQLEKPPYHFDFEHLKPMIEVFFEEGFDTLETGGLLQRGYLPDGSPDMYSNSYKCPPNWNVSVDSDEGYELLNCVMRDFSDFLRQNHWDKKVLFHISDEPDVHVKSEEDLNARRMQYFLAANIVRKYLPNVRIIEAIKTTAFRGAIDILVPVTDGYQNNKPAFDRAIDMGDEVWNYVCCGPEGIWLNRFLDQPLINGRLLFWGFAANRVTGYLHWGFNQFEGVKDPFTATSCYNPTGIGSNFPCGDAFIVYPGKEEPWLSMRLEAERRGAEEAALLDALYEKNPEYQKQLIAKIFKRYDEYNNDPALVEQVYKELLESMSV